MLHTGFHIQQCNFILRKGQMSNKLLQNAVHGTGTALIGFVNLSAGHELYSAFFTVIFLWDICHGEIFGEKLLGKGRKLHSVQNTRGHHGFEGFILAAKIFGKISGQLDTQLTVQTEIGFIGVHYQHPFFHASQFFCKECSHGAFSAAALAAYGYFHQNSSHVLRIPKITSS